MTGHSVDGVRYERSRAKGAKLAKAEQAISVFTLRALRTLREIFRFLAPAPSRAQRASSDLHFCLIHDDGVTDDFHCVGNFAGGFDFDVYDAGAT